MAANYLLVIKDALLFAFILIRRLNAVPGCALDGHMRH